MQREWSAEELIGSWTLVDEDWRLVSNKSGPTRLGFALLLKFFEIEARFPRNADELPSAAIAYVAEQVKVDPAEFARYQWSGRAIERRRVQIRTAFGFREFSRGDEPKLAAWLAEEVCPVELRDEQLREGLLVRCRSERIEPPGRVERIIGSARAAFEQRFCERTTGRLSGQWVRRLEALVSEEAGRNLLAELKTDPGQVGLETLLREIDKLAAVRVIGLPTGLFSDASEKLVEAWRARAARSYPSDLRAAPAPVRLTLLASLCWLRASEITDALVDLLVGLVHKINARADRRVERELTEDLRRVRGKETILFRLAEAAVEHPDDTVREALFPVVGEKTLRELVREAKANERVFQARVRTVLRGSYSSYYRRMLPPLLAALRFRCDNTAYRPLMHALDLLARYAAVDGKVRFFADTAAVPLDGVVPRAWRAAVVDERGRVERIPYELCVLVALRDALRRREIYVDGANRWRNPDDDLPGDFETTREVHYAAIRQPLDPTEFIAGLRERLAAAVDRFDSALEDRSAGGVAITTRRGEPWMTVPRLEALPEPVNLQRVKDEVIRRWGTLDLLDVLKDSDFLADFTTEFSSVASREVIDRDTLRRRLLLCLFALGTNMGLKAIVATGEHGESEAALRHVRRHFITRDNLRRAIAKLVNATFDARDPAWWGTGTTCASDTREQYAYRFSTQQVVTVRRALPCGDYGVTIDGRLIAAVERKSLPDLTSSLINGTLRYLLGELAALPRAAVVVEDRYSQIFKLDRIRPAVVADGLAELQVRWPGVPIVFCETRQLAEEWTFRYLAAAHAWAATEHAVADRIGADLAAVETLTAPNAPEPTTAELRAWASAAGIAVPDRGRLRPEVWQAWREAHAPDEERP